MKRTLHLHSWTTAAAVVAALAFGTASDAQERPEAPASAQTAQRAQLFRGAVRPEQGIVEFHQVAFELGRTLIKSTDWGSLSVDRDRLAAAFGPDSLYVNVIHQDSAGRAALWMVENLFIPAAPSAQPQQAYPVSRYLDLRPGVEGDGTVPYLNVMVLVSDRPLPFVADVIELAGRMTPYSIFPVTASLEVAGGDLGEEPLSSPRQGAGSFLIGPPPQASRPPFAPDFDLAIPIGVYQASYPNVETARNQCVPMAHANVVQFLENQVNAVPLPWSWAVPEAPIPGVGRLASFGDVVFWEPVPDSSLVAHVDTRTTRAGVHDADTGSGSNRCQNIRGVMGYLHARNLSAVFRHQGGDALYGDGGSCDSTAFSNVGTLSSTREGSAPTWQWIFDQLSLGRGVSLSYGRYDDAGDRTGGHMLRVWGASSVNGVRYLHLLDDGNQGSNNVGLQLRQFAVADTGSPGAPGVPDGRLNIDGGSAEIEFAISIQALPTLYVP